MIIILAIITSLILIIVAMRFLVKDFAKFVIRKTTVLNIPKTFIDFGEYFSTWFFTFIIAVFGFWFYKFETVLTSYVLSNDLISFFITLRSVFSITSASQNPFTFQHMVAGFILLPALQFIACFVIYKAIKTFMIFVNTKYKLNVYNESDLLYFGFVAIIFFMCCDIAAYSQDIPPVSALAHFIYLAISKLACIAYFLTIAHNQLLASSEYKKTLPEYLHLKSLERKILLSPWKNVLLTYLIGAILNFPFILGTQFLKNNSYVILACLLSCFLFFIILKTFLHNGYNFIGAVVFYHRINIESILLAKERYSKKYYKQLLSAAGVLGFIFAIYQPKIFFFIFCIVAFLLIAIVMLFIFGYFLFLSCSILRGRRNNAVIPDVLPPALQYMKRTIIGFIKSVLLVLFFMIFITMLLSIAPKKYHYNHDETYVRAVVDEEGYPLYIKYGHGNNTIPVAYETLPPFLIKCLVIQEDRSFFEQNSLFPHSSTWHGVAPALFYRPFTGSGGGTNLDAGLIKNDAFDGSFPADIQRKFSETVAAFQLSLQLTPKQIATQYFTKVGFNGANTQSGIAMGALYTFGLPVQKLNPLEMLYLVRTIKRGFSFRTADSTINYANASANRFLIKKALLEQATSWYNHDFITKKELNAIKSQDLRFTNTQYKTLCTTSTKDFLNKQMDKKDTACKTYQSTISITNQQLMQDAVTEFNAEFRQYLKNGDYTLFTSSIVINIHTGQILAHYGSDNIVDLTTIGTGRNMGSLIKPFIVCELLERGFDADKIRLYDGPVAGLKTPKDFGAYSYKNLGIDDALAQSRNACFVNIRLKTDPIAVYKNVENRFSQMGIPSDPYLNLNDHKLKTINVLNYPLGSRNMTLLNIAQAYQTLFNEGKYIKLSAIASYYDPYKDSTVKVFQVMRQIYSPKNATRIKSALHQTMMDGGTANHLNKILKTKKRMYAKTGTSDNAMDAACCITDGNVLVISYLSYGQIKNDHLKLGLAPIPFGAAGKSAGVLSAIVYNQFLK